MHLTFWNAILKQISLTDVTGFALYGIKLYLSPIIDLYNGAVVSYNLSRHPNLAQTTDNFEKTTVLIMRVSKTFSAC